MARNPFSFTNRTFSSIYLELKSIYPDKPDWFITMISGLFDILHWYLDARAQNTMLPSAITEESIYDLLKMIGYDLASASPASGSVDLTLDSTANAFNILQSELTFSITTPTGALIKFDGTQGYTVAQGDPTTLTIDIVQGETITDAVIGSSDGTTAWQEFIISDPNLITRPIPAITCTVNGTSYTHVETLVNSGANDKHFMTERRPSGFTAVIFGDGTMGFIPPAFSINVTYRTGGGVSGNVPAGSTVSYTGANSHITSVASVATAFTGGAAAENVEVARALAPKMIKRIHRAVTEEDYEFKSINYSSEVFAAKCIPHLYGQNTIAVHIIPSGGGNPSSQLKAGLQQYLIDRSPLQQADVRVRDPLYVTQDVTATVKMKTGYTFATYLPYMTLAVRLLISETVPEIISLYESDGIAAAISFINNKWSTTFNATDYVEIIKLIEKVRNAGVIGWGDTLHPADIVSIIDGVTGVDYPVVSLPAGAVALTSTQVMTEGTITITEI